MTMLQKVLLTIFVFLISIAYLGWLGTDPRWIGFVGVGFVIAVVVEAFLAQNTRR